MSASGKSKQGERVIAQLVAGRADGSTEPSGAAAATLDKDHVSTTIIQRLSNASRASLNWMALRTSSTSGKEPKIDSDADASWKAR
jgi:hypothetical protein